jgi:hypothetical protein
MRDFIQDWRKWTRSERVVSVLFVIALLIGLPALTTNLVANAARPHFGILGIRS